MKLSRRACNHTKLNILCTLDGFDDVSVFLDDSERSDENVDRAEKLTGLLQNRVTGSALLALLMTPQYLRSKWCRQELEWWCEKHHPDTLRAGARVYPCWVLPSDKAGWPEAIKDVAGYFCYDCDIEPEDARPFAWRGAEDDRYGAVLTAIAGAMARRLGTKAILDEERRRKEQVRKYAAADVKTLFLHGRKGSKDAWGEACARLQTSGFAVLPGGTVPVGDDGGIDLEYQRQLKKSDGLLLLGAEEGPAIDTDILVIGRDYQREAVAQGSLLPGAVINMIGPRPAHATAAAERRKSRSLLDQLDRRSIARRGPFLAGKSSTQLERVAGAGL